MVPVSTRCVLSVLFGFIGKMESLDEYNDYFCDILSVLFGFIEPIKAITSSEKLDQLFFQFFLVLLRR